MTEYATSSQHAETIYIIDDDALVRTSLEIALSTQGYRAIKFASARYFLTQLTSLELGCVLLDIRMPGMDGLQLQEELVRRDLPLSIIIMTGYADVPMAVEAMQRGAVDVLQKPIDNEKLLPRIENALALAREKAERAAIKEMVLKNIARLTVRERDVLRLIVSGHTNRHIAQHLELSQRTVEAHRAQVMRKMNAESLARLVRMTAGIVW